MIKLASALLFYLLNLIGKNLKEFENSCFLWDIKKVGLIEIK